VWDVRQGADRARRALEYELAGAQGTSLVIVRPFHQTHQAALDGWRVAVSASIPRPVCFAPFVRAMECATQPSRRVLAARPAHHGLVAPPPWSGRRVLIAEDNVINQRVAARFIEKLGCQADVVANGVEAVEAAMAVRYDLILMDCQMPEMDGFAATERIRTNERDGHVPIVALTASALVGDRERCLSAGMDDYLAKPVTARDIATICSRWLPAPRGRTSGLGNLG
jgi:CheY-like chemotaxis protein